MPILPAYSQKPVKYNLDQLEGILLGKNSSLEALYYQLESALYQHEGNHLKWGPRLRINYNSYPENQIAQDYSVSSYEQLGEVSLVYPIIDILFNRHYSEQEKEQLVEETQALLAAGQLELLLELRRKFVLALKEKRLAAEYGRRKEQLSQWVTETKQRHYYKQALSVEVLDIEALQLANEQALEQHRQDYSLKLTQLALLAGLEDKEWEAVPTLGLPSFLPDKKSLLKELDEHPLIKIYRIRALRDNIRQKSSWLGQLKLDAVAGFMVGEDRDSTYRSGSHLRVMFSVPLAYNKLVDYQKLSLLDEQKRWEAEAFAKKLKLKQQLAAVYIKVEGINKKRELAQKQLRYAKEKIGFLKAQMEYPLSEPENPWQRLIGAYRQQWRVQEELLELGYQRQTAYYELVYLSGKNRLPQPVAKMSLAPATDNRPQLAPQALYIEDTSLLADPFLIRFCRSKGITRVLLNIDQLFLKLEAPPWLPESISGLHQQDIRVWAMLSPDNLAIPQTNLNPLLTYNEQHIISESFDGLHLHFNPPRNQGEDSEPLKAGLNNRLIHIKKLSEQLKGLSPPLKLGLSIPHWYDKLDMQLLADSIYYADEVLVTFPKRFKAAELLEMAEDELRLGVQMGRRIWLALDCTDFDRDNRPHMEEYMERVRNQSPPEIGFVIFDYQGYLEK